MGAAHARGAPLFSAIVAPQGRHEMKARLIADHVDYLSVRPDPDRVLAAGYVNPMIKK